MKNTADMASRFREVILNGTWIANTNYKDELTNTDWQTAITSFKGFNTIAVLAKHIHYYIHGIKQVFEGGDLEISDKYSFDFPDVKSQDEWESFLERFWKDAEKLATLIEQIPEEKITQVFVDEKYGTYERNIDGMIEHCYYHLGQIVLIKKLLLNN